MTDDQPESPVFARAEGLRPRVRQSDSPLAVTFAVLGALILGGLVFNALSSGRAAKAQAVAVTAAPVAAPPPPPAPAPAPPPVMMTATRPPAPMVADPDESHLRAPAVVVDLGAGPAAGMQMAQAAAAPLPANELRQSADERFAARVAGAGADTAHATQMHDLGRTVPQGAVIAAVLETAIDSDLPGSVRAVVSRDVRSFDGAQVLIPRGSKLIGQYKSAAAVGQTRAFVIWSRIISPTGVSIDVGSPAADRLGRGGLEGKVDDHFFRRFGASILLSVVNAGLSAAANSNHGDTTTLVIGSPAQASQVAEIALQKQIDIPATIRVAQGAPVQVFVARDLDFSAVAP